MIIKVKLELMFNNKDKDKNSKRLNFGKKNSNHRNDYIRQRDNGTYVNYKSNNLSYIRKDMK